MKKKEIKSQYDLLKENMSEKRLKDFEELFDKFYTYLYTYEIGYPEDFNEKEKVHWKKYDFYEMVKEMAYCIKCSEGY